jgi:hypothetical protein
MGYDNIIKSLYLLDYIDLPLLLQNVQRALNRGESYHKLCRAISYADFGKLRFKKEQEQQIWNECSRLLTNYIIYYNASILSNLLTYREKNNDDQDMAVLKQVSPIAWQQINLYGRYEFNKRSMLIKHELYQKHMLYDLEVFYPLQRPRKCKESCRQFVNSTFHELLLDLPLCFFWKYILFPFYVIPFLVFM